MENNFQCILLHQIQWSIDKKDIKENIIEKEKKIIKEELKNLGKPKEIAEKISLGKINKFKEDNSLAHSRLGYGS